MPIGSWKDLCVDVMDPAVMGPFWAETLGLEPKQLDDGDVVLNGPSPEHRVWLNTVPEPVTVKQRVHLDVHAAGSDEVLARGATPEDMESFRWDVLRDPEGGELCVFTREEVPDYKLYEIVVDSADPAAIAAWWHGVLGGELGGNEEKGWAWLDQVPGMPFENIVFVRVPEAKTVKNRVHWDVDTSDVQLLLDHGATVLRRRDDEIGWQVLADPEGNEFCAFVPQQG
jgi:glyoxalase superfamily protein